MPAVLIGIAIAGMLFFALVTSGSWLTQLAEIGSYLLITLFLALGLMAKSMIVTLPCVFLLLDIWPLGRWQRALWPPGSKRLRTRFLRRDLAAGGENSLVLAGVPATR